MCEDRLDSMTARNPSQPIAIGADHGGYRLKELLKERLTGRGMAVDDCGTFDEQKADYPRIAASVAGAVSEGRAARGIIIDGAGIGSAMVANRFPRVRAALCYDISSARNSREHNDANVLTLGARLIGEGLAEQIVDVWLDTDCTEERHRRRVAMIEEAGRNTATDRSPDRTPRAVAPPARDTRTQEESQTDVNTPISLDNLSQDDVDRIAARIAELVGTPGMNAAALRACSCCGPQCNGHCAATDPATVRGFLGIGAGRIGNGPGGGPIAQDVAACIDHTLLKAEATAAQVEQLCEEARKHHFASVCLNPSYVRLAASRLAGSPVAVCTVVGFPLGAHVPEIKAMEARRSIREGAREIDMVINIGALKSGQDDLVYRDIRGVVESCEEGRALCKVIIECALLTDDEKVRACRLAKRARADFVKTSTGFSTGGATAQDVALMAEVVRGTGMGVKAAGGIRTYADFEKMVKAGATRIGASAGIKIVKESKGVTVSG